MKFTVLLLAAVSGAVIAGAPLTWRYEASRTALQQQISELHRQLEGLQQQAATHAGERERQATANAATIADLQRQLGRAGTAAQLAEEDRRRLEGELAKARRDLAATQREYSATQAALAAAQANVARLTAAPAIPATPAAKATADYDATHEAALRSQMSRRYGALLDKLGLSAADADRFLGLMVSRRQAADDVLAANLATGTGGNDISGLVATTRDGIESDLRSLLGDAGYSQFKRYEASIGTSGTLGRLQTALAGSAPLNDDQAAQLQQLITDSGVGHLTPQVLAKAQSQGFLTPEQSQALQALYAQQRAAQQQRRTGGAAATHP